MSRRNKSFGYSKKYAASQKSFRRLNRNIARAITPSKRTQRAIAKSLFSTSGAKRTSYRKTKPVKWKYAKPTKKQLLTCVAIGAVCTYPVFANGNFDGSSASFFALVLFFYFPFSAAFISVINHNKEKYRKYGPKGNEVALEKEFPCNPSEPVENPTSEDFLVQIDCMNAKIFMDEFQDSLSIMQKTAIPETFFSRYDLVMQRLDNMIALQQKGIKFTGDPLSLKAQALDEENIADTVNILIDNAYQKQLQKLSTLKTERGRANSNQRWYASFEPYFDKMPTRSKTYLDLKLEELKEV